MNGTEWTGHIPRRLDAIAVLSRPSKTTQWANLCEITNFVRTRHYRFELIWIFKTDAAYTHTHTQLPTEKHTHTQAYTPGRDQRPVIIDNNGNKSLRAMFFSYGLSVIWTVPDSSKVFARVCFSFLVQGTHRAKKSKRFAYRIIIIQWERSNFDFFPIIIFVFVFFFCFVFLLRSLLWTCSMFLAPVQMQK